MKAFQTYIIHKDPPSNLELLVQILSVCTFKYLNPEVKIIFATDKKSLDFYNRVGFLDLYDEVITDVFDDYPYDRVSPDFWATPKLWLMSKINEPFIIFDVDLILNQPISIFGEEDLTYLHRELQSSYFRPHEVSVSPSWDWEDLLYYFRRTMPINVAVLFFKDMKFKNYYVDYYLKFVLDNKGGTKFPDEDYIPKNGLQTFAEQYLLSALIFKYQMDVNQNFKSNSLTKTVFCVDFFYENGNYDEYSENPLAPLLYHLWSAKEYVNVQGHPHYIKAYNDVTIQGENHLKYIGYWNRVSNIFEKLKNGLVRPTN
jgi:hypothetical protein